jgi:hypothetical protein
MLVLGSLLGILVRRWRENSSMRYSLGSMSSFVLMVNKIVSENVQLLGQTYLIFARNVDATIALSWIDQALVYVAVLVHYMISEQGLRFASRKGKKISEEGRQGE